MKVGSESSSVRPRMWFVDLLWLSLLQDPRTSRILHCSSLRYVVYLSTIGMGDNTSWQETNVNAKPPSFLGKELLWKWTDKPKHSSKEWKIDLSIWYDLLILYCQSLSINYKTVGHSLAKWGKYLLPEIKTKRNSRPLSEVKCTRYDGQEKKTNKNKTD